MFAHGAPIAYLSSLLYGQLNCPNDKTFAEDFGMTEQSLSYNDYLAGLPDERKDAVKKVWRIVRENMPQGYTEQIGPKFLSFTADNDWYVALANQKNYISLYLIPLYVFPELKARLDAASKNLKCGKSCINFKRAEELPLDVIGEIVGAHDAESYKQHVRQARSAERPKKKSGSKQKKKSASKSSARQTV